MPMGVGAMGVGLGVGAGVVGVVAAAGGRPLCGEAESALGQAGGEPRLIDVAPAAATPAAAVALVAGLGSCLGGSLACGLRAEEGQVVCSRVGDCLATVCPWHVSTG